AQQTEVTRQPSSGRQVARGPFGLLESVEVVQRVTAQQHRLRTARMPGTQAQRALLSQAVIARIKTFARLADQRPAQLFQRATGVPCGADGRLQSDDLLID